MTHRFSICACARWETPYIVEWLNYYRAIGFDHVYLYCNDDDPTALYEATLPFTVDSAPFVTFRHYPYQGQQELMYRHFLRTNRTDTEWIAFLDIDEFLVLKGVDDIRRFMAPWERECDSLYFNWCFYGNSGFEKRPTGSVLLQYTRRQAGLHPFTKTITRTAAIDIVALEHRRGVHFWHRWDSPAGDAMRRVNVIGETMADYYRDFPSHAVSFLNGNDRHRRIMEVAFVAHIAFKSKEDFLLRVERGTLGDFSGQTLWKTLHDDGRIDEFLGALNAVETTYLRDLWCRTLQGGWRASVVPRAPGPNLALGRPATQSSLSQWSIGKTLDEDASRATDGQLTGQMRFCTDIEESPWWRVDLGDRYAIGEIRLFNRIDDPGCVDRASRLEISVSEDDNTWTVVGRKLDDKQFGGVDGAPLICRTVRPISGRFVRVRLLRRTFLHLDQVEVYPWCDPDLQEADLHVAFPTRG